jgi:asparagine synthase (glutamine-hydrolysing)
MCGIGVIVSPDGTNSRDAWAMADALHHRGPDGAGVVMIEAGLPVRARRDSHVVGQIALAFTRLAIIDLSTAGMQPMSNEDESVWVVFNGEVYNFSALRNELEGHGHVFRSRTDTEVLVHGWEEWGESLFDRIEGMFAFCLHDARQKRTLFVRDKLGVKPLYYAQRTDGAFLAASEIKALFAASLDVRLDLEALDSFLTWLWVPDPQTAFSGVRKLEPGHYLDLREGFARLRRYWDLEYCDSDHAPTAEELRDAVGRAVKRQLVSDVPLGAFFSGGLDSAAVVALMAAEVESPPTCFTIGLSEHDLSHDIVGDDLEYARAFAEEKPIRYRERVLSADLADALPKVIWHMDEPIADPAALSAFSIAEAASKELTVMLTGVGGDEVFGGYPRYRAERLLRGSAAIPAPLVRLLASVARALPAAGAGPLPRFGRNAQKLLRGANLPFPDDYFALLTYFDARARQALYSDDLRQTLASADPEARHRIHLSAVRGRPWLDQAMYLDAKTFLPSLNLTYMDKMTMAHSIEARVPLLDEAVVGLMRTSRPTQRLRRGLTKPLFREAVAGVVPDSIIRRPKAGFTSPIRAWLRHDLRELAQDLLSASHVERRGLFRPGAVAHVMDSFYSGRTDNALQIWQLLTLELWQQAFLDAGSRSAQLAVMTSGGRA